MSNKVWDGNQWVASLWRPIDSAPKDGSRVLCWAYGFREAVFCTFVNKKFQEPAWKTFIAEGYKTVYPTHWYELPAFPKQVEEGVLKPQSVELPWAAGVEPPKIEYTMQGGDLHFTKQATPEEWEKVADNAVDAFRVGLKNPDGTDMSDEQKLELAVQGTLAYKRRYEERKQVQEQLSAVNPNARRISKAMIQAEAVEREHIELNRIALRATILRQVLSGQGQDKKTWLKYATTEGSRFILARERYNNISDVWYVGVDEFFWMWSSTNRDEVVNVAKAFGWTIVSQEEEQV